MGRTSRRKKSVKVVKAGPLQHRIPLEVDPARVTAHDLVVDPAMNRDEFPQCELGEDGQIVMVEVDRRDTAAESLDALNRTMNILSTPGVPIDGFITPVQGLVVVMKDVGVVLRHADGTRARCGCADARCNATLWWIAAKPETVWATLDTHVARSRTYSRLSVHLRVE